MKHSFIVSFQDKRNSVPTFITTNYKLFISIAPVQPYNKWLSNEALHTTIDIEKWNHSIYVYTIMVKNERDGRFTSLFLLSFGGLVTDSSYQSHPT